MKSRALFHFFATPLLFAMGFISQSAQADSLYWWPWAPPPALVYETPTPLYEPLGYYRCSTGCCRRPIWRAGHWHSVIACERFHEFKGAGIVRK